MLESVPAIVQAGRCYTCLGLLETRSVRDVVNVIDGSRVFAACTTPLQLESKDDVVKPRVLHTYTQSVTQSDPSPAIRLIIGRHDLGHLKRDSQAYPSSSA